METRYSTLYFRDIRSDKEYTVTIKSDPHEIGYWNVICYFGRRGANQQEHYETKSPTSRVRAEWIAKQVIAKKRDKGYRSAAESEADRRREVRNMGLMPPSRPAFTPPAPKPEPRRAPAPQPETKNAPSRRYRLTEED